MKQYERIGLMMIFRPPRQLAYYLQATGDTEALDYSSDSFHPLPALLQNLSPSLSCSRLSLRRPPRGCQWQPRSAHGSGRFIGATCARCPRSLPRRATTRRSRDDHRASRPESVCQVSVFPLRRPPRRSLRTTPPIHWPTCHRCCQCRLLLRSSASAARRPIGTQRVEPCLSGGTPT